MFHVTASLKKTKKTIVYKYFDLLFSLICSLSNTLNIYIYLFIYLFIYNTNLPNLPLEDGGSLWPRPHIVAPPNAYFGSATANISTS